MVGLYCINFALKSMESIHLHVYICISLHGNSLNERHASFWKPTHANLCMQMDRFSLRSIQNLWNISVLFVKIWIFKFDILSVCLSVSQSDNEKGLYAWMISHISSHTDDSMDDSKNKKTKNTKNGGCN